MEELLNYSKGVDLINTKKDDKVLNLAISDNIYKGKNSNSKYINFFKQYILEILAYFILKI